MRNTPQGEEFIEIQRKRKEKGLRNEFYDLTGWSLPLLYDIKAWETAVPSGARTEEIKDPVELKGEVIGGQATLAYLVPWGSNSSAKLLAELFRRDIRVFSSDLPFTILDREFPAGSLIVQTKNNPEDLFQQISETASESGAKVYATDSSWVNSGPNFGSDNVRYLERPKVLLLYDQPTNPSSAGATRFLLEQQYGYPVTIVQGMNLARTDLSSYNVLILPASYGYRGSASGILSQPVISQIRDWVRNGGTLIALGSATELLTGEDAGLLATSAEFKEDPDKKGTDEKDARKTRPDDIPGAILRLKLDNTLWVAFGLR